MVATRLLVESMQNKKKKRKIAICFAAAAHNVCSIVPKRILHQHSPLDLQSPLCLQSWWKDGTYPWMDSAASSGNTAINNILTSDGNSTVAAGLSNTAAVWSSWSRKGMARPRLNPKSLPLSSHSAAPLHTETAAAEGSSAPPSSSAAMEGISIKHVNRSQAAQSPKKHRPSVCPVLYSQLSTISSYANSVCAFVFKWTFIEFDTPALINNSCPKVSHPVAQECWGVQNNGQWQYHSRNRNYWQYAWAQGTLCISTQATTCKGKQKVTKDSIKHRAKSDDDTEPKKPRAAKQVIKASRENPTAVAGAGAMDKLNSSFTSISLSRNARLNQTVQYTTTCTPYKAGKVMDSTLTASMSPRPTADTPPLYCSWLFQGVGFGWLSHCPNHSPHPLH